MKKFASLLLATVVTATVFTGCGSNGTLGTTGGSSNESQSSYGTSSTTPSTTSSAASSSTEAGYADENGNAEGRLGDTMHTYFFDYTVNSAYLCDEYEGYTPQEGNELLVADITVKNTHIASIEMYDTDFQIQWNDDAEDAYDFPITYYLEEGETYGDDMLPYLYELSIDESVTGVLVYEVPEGNKDFSISYLELFDDDSEGDVFFVYFSAEKQ